MLTGSLIYVMLHEQLKRWTIWKKGEVWGLAYGDWRRGGQMSKLVTSKIKVRRLNRYHLRHQVYAFQEEKYYKLNWKDMNLDVNIQVQKT